MQPCNLPGITICVLYNGCIYNALLQLHWASPSDFEGNSYTLPKEIHFPRYNMKFSGDNVILQGIVHVVSCFPLHFMLYSENLDFFSDSVNAVHILYVTKIRGSCVNRLNFSLLC